MGTSKRPWYGRKRYLALMVLAAGLVAYLCLLLTTTYLSVTDLQKSLLDQVRQETERRAASLDYFFSERKDDLKNLASSKEITVLFESRLRQLRTGKGTSLSALPTDHLLHDLLSRKKIGQDVIYARIAVIDQEGQPLVDTWSMSPQAADNIDWKKLLAPELQQGAIVTTPRQKDVMVSIAHYAEDSYAGQVVAWIRTEIIYNHLLKDERALKSMPIFLISGKENVYLPAGVSMAPDLLALPDFGMMEIRKPREFWAVAREGIKPNKMIALRIPVKGTPLSLLHIGEAAATTGLLPVWHLLAGAGILVIMLFTVLFTIIRAGRWISALKLNLEQTVEEKNDIDEQYRVLATEMEAQKGFLASIGQELRLPLSSILIFAENIKRKLEGIIYPQLHTGDENVRKAMDRVLEHITVMSTEGKRLASLINDVLDMAKMEAGQWEWHDEPVSLQEVIDQAFSTIEPLYTQKNIIFLKDVPEALPEISGDKDRLIQVVVNLLSNALSYTETGTVTCHALRNADDIIVSVIDAGSGIPVEEQEKIFEKFWQVKDHNGLKRRATGTELGLPICRQIVERHGGKIWVESVPGQGSSFFFSLPTERPVDQEL